MRKILSLENLQNSLEGYFFGAPGPAHILKMPSNYEFNSQYSIQNTNTKKKRKEHKIQNTMMKIV